MTMAQTRTEKDSLGTLELPDSVYWGIQTARALQNFPINFQRTAPQLIKAYALVKQACTETNLSLGFLAQDKATAIIQACQEIASGKLADQFPIDALQGGAGTSTNMNLNEVIANRAIEILGGEFGEYQIIHPLEQVNLHQSTNDTYPTAFKIAAIQLFKILSDSIAKTQGALQKQEQAFADVLLLGRTELQEAVPMTLGKIFSGWGEGFGRDRWRTFKCEERLRVVNLGGTAVGTGLCAPRQYIFQVTEKLRTLTGLGLARSENPVADTALGDVYVEVSGMLKAHATNLIRIANDLRLLNAFKEIHLPEKQTGSSIMPGKYNPVICEAVMQIGMQVIASDNCITDAVSRGTLQIVEFLPLVAHHLLTSLDISIKANELLTQLIPAIKPNLAVCQNHINQSESLITAFVPHIGYTKASELISLFKKSGQNNLREFLYKHLDKNMVDQTLLAGNITKLGY